MRSSLRFLLVCMLAFALPFKALAAVSMVGCGPGHHGAVGGPTVSAPGGSHASHGGHASNRGHHGFDGEHVVESGDKSAGAAEVGKHLGAKLADAKCSSCAPCSAAAAPAPDAPGFAKIEPAVCAVRSGDDRYSGVVGDVPHEPPRPFLA